jgi:hypothetical protein
MINKKIIFAIKIPLPNPLLKGEGTSRNLFSNESSLSQWERVGEREIKQ